MGRLIRFIEQISSFGSILGGIILVFIMLLTIASVLFRLFGSAIVGSYELTELVIVVTVGFALVYSTMTRANVAVHLFYDRFSPSLQKIINIFIISLSLCFWGWMAWETLRMTIDRGWIERSETFLLPLFPFRLIWILGLSVLTFLLLAQLIKGIFGSANK